ncbi:unnamed protein product [Lactuca saligna]|uniref:SWIM-type domain-containing protein n=1 Tax=Lactuca saligna TaxID=75948 RepID=A0AA36A3R4_LACSI|nr:unnamed protein product [Lactuca saligna]
MTDFNLNLDKDDGCVQMDGFHNRVGANDEHEDIEVIDNNRWDSLHEGLKDERKRNVFLRIWLRRKDAVLAIGVVPVMNARGLVGLNTKNKSMGKEEQLQKDFEVGVYLDKVFRAKEKGPLTPTATTILDVNKSHASHYIARWNGGEKYQVTGAWQDQHGVAVRNNTCTCRKWELIGIPYKHAIATFYEMTKNLEDVGDIYR